MDAILKWQNQFYSLHNMLLHIVWFISKLEIFIRIKKNIIISEIKYFFFIYYDGLFKWIVQMLIKQKNGC